MSQKPTIGRIVIFHEGDLEAYISAHGFSPDQRTQDRWRSIPAEYRPTYPGTYGTRFHPAIITRVWTDTYVNLTVLFGSGAVEPRQSAVLLPDNAFADGALCQDSGCFWPPRTAQ